MLNVIKTDTATVLSLVSVEDSTYRYFLPENDKYKNWVVDHGHTYPDDSFFKIYRDSCQKSNMWRFSKRYDKKGRVLEDSIFKQDVLVHITRSFYDDEGKLYRQTSTSLEDSTCHSNSYFNEEGDEISSVSNDSESSWIYEYDDKHNWISRFYTTTSKSSLRPHRSPIVDMIIEPQKEYKDYLIREIKY